MKLFKDKKGLSLSAVPTAVMILVVIAVILGVGATILTQVQGTQTANSIAYNATGQGLEGIKTVSNWQSTWAVILAAAVVIGIVTAYLVFKGG
jgi:hypothetical protein